MWMQLSLLDSKYGQMQRVHLFTVRDITYALHCQLKACIIFLDNQVTHDLMLRSNTIMKSSIMLKLSK
jgi:hypothetical protein